MLQSNQLLLVRFPPYVTAAAFPFMAALNVTDVLFRRAGLTDRRILLSQIDSGHFPNHRGINLLRLASDGGWQDRHNGNSRKVALVSHDL